MEKKHGGFFLTAIDFKNSLRAYLFVSEYKNLNIHINLLLDKLYQKV